MNDNNTKIRDFDRIGGSLTHLSTEYEIKFIMSRLNILFSKQDKSKFIYYQLFHKILQFFFENGTNEFSKILFAYEQYVNII